jgi:NAD(P)-dependent dehydrogenase (short-subunit alcohol dehydrogenase family)
MALEVAPLRVLDRFRLDGKVAIVTGASSGLGVAFAMALAEAGADLALGARRTEGLASTQAAVEQLGRRGIYISTDVSRPEDCTALVEGAVAEFGHVDILVNNAGTSDAVPALKQSPDDFRRVVDVNLHGSYWMAQACARVMPPGSSIINISSVIGLSQGDIPSAGYSSSKSALVGLTHDLAGQWTSRKGIRVNALAPGYIGTEMTQPLIENKTLYATVLARIPMGRFGEPVELCGALLFLASDASSFVTGVTLPVDGGWMMR